jgi:hypothetical protein
MPRARLALAPVLVALAGCLAPDAPTPTDAGFALEASAAECVRVLTAAFVPRDHLATFLPPGFHAADATRFVGANGIDSGRGVALASVASCRTSMLQEGPFEEALFGVFVETPRVAGEPASGDSFYEVSRAGSGAFEDRLARLGWPIDGTSAHASPSGEASVADADGTLFEVRAGAAPYPEDSTYHVRWWHDAPRGSGWLDARFHVTGRLGEGACSARAGSTFARLVAATECPPGTLVLAGPPFDIAATFEYRAGLHASG